MRGTPALARPIAILDEHPDWSSRLMAELDQRRLPFEKIDPSSHAWDPRDRTVRYSVVVNRTSPSSHRRGHGNVLFYGLDFGPDGTALLQEYVEPRDNAIVRVEVLDGRALYAIRIVRSTPADFNLCPADLCRLPAAADAALAACPVDPSPGLQVTRYDAPPDSVKTAEDLTRAASIDVGGVEYLVGADDGLTYFYDVNATSNFVANAPEVLGFDPFPPFADYIARRAR